MISRSQLVAIVGRPNVGKSALFNRLIGRAAAIVEDRSGVTRDRHFGKVEWTGRHFWAVDTGGFDPEEDGELSSAQVSKAIREGMRRQVRLAIEESTQVVWVVDGKAGLHPLDEAVAKLLREYKKPVILAVNKSDTAADLDNQFDFAKLGADRVVPISALHGRGVDDLLEEIVKGMPQQVDDSEGKELRIAIVGRPNVGKSSILNALLNEERNIVSDLPGTTRDAVDTPIRAHGRDLVLVDTAGLRAKGKVIDELEKYSALRSIRAIENCHVALLVIDAYEGINEQDERVAGLVHEAGRACVIVVNKWDLLDKSDGTYEKCLASIRERFKFMDYALTAFVSAKSRQRLGDLLSLAIQAGDAHEKRISTGKLNRALEEILASAPLPSHHKRTLKVFYLAQTGVRPPSFALFVNDPKLMHFSTQRRIKKQLREKFDLPGTPLILMLRKRA
jgi:GTP-binding protein